MARDPNGLNELQYNVLKWISDGCPKGHSLGDAHRITARGLHNRSMAFVDGRGSTWTASITGSGTRALEAYERNVLQPPKDAAMLIDGILAKDGRLSAAEFETSVSVDVLIAAAAVAPNRPHGKRVETQRPGGWTSPDVDWVLVENLADMAPVKAVPVPDKVHKYHPALEGFRGNRKHLGFTAAEFERAARILNAVALESEARGYSVRAGELADNQGLPPRTGNVVVEIRDIEHPVSISPARPSVAQGRPWLQLQLPMRQHSRNEWVFVDRSKQKLEERLPDFFHEIEIAQLEGERRAEQATVEAERRRVAWERARAHAEVQIQIDHKLGVLREQIILSREAKDIREYAARVRAVQGTNAASNDEWMTWAEAYADSIDPALGALKLPGDRAFSPYDLKPYMRGMNPLKPEW